MLTVFVFSKNPILKQMVFFSILLILDLLLSILSWFLGVCIIIQLLELCV